MDYYQMTDDGINDIMSMGMNATLGTLKDEGF